MHRGLAATLLIALGSFAIGHAQGSPPRAATVLDVLTFNAALLPEIAADTDQATRAARMAPHLRGYDVLVLQELFVDRWREALLDELEDDYPYQGGLVGADGARGMPWRQDGGVVILSRWPIERQASLTFDAVCSGSDCLADKGVAYAAVRAGERLVHVFGTHAQSVFGRDVETVRAAQFALLRAFAVEQAIPADEPVLFVGDFNVDAYTPELDQMLDVLGAVWPGIDGDVLFTWDPRSNEWAGGRRQQWFDYALVAADHARPRAASNRALPLRDGELDLSDHFAVWGRFVWP